MAYRLGRRAERDLIDHFLQGARDFRLPPAEAYHYLSAKTFEFLADNPEAVWLRTETEPPVRIHPVRSHFVVYRVEDDGEVFVIRIRHGHEDWAAAGD